MGNTDGNKALLPSGLAVVDLNSRSSQTPEVLDGILISVYLSSHHSFLVVNLLASVTALG